MAEGKDRPAQYGSSDIRAINMQDFTYAQKKVGFYLMLFFLNCFHSRVKYQRNVFVCFWCRIRCARASRQGP